MKRPAHPGAIVRTSMESEGWTVMRFSGRTLSRDLDACVDAIVDRLASD